MNKVSCLCLCMCVVLRPAGCAAPRCSPADTDAVGQRLSTAETGASVPEQGEQTELAARHRQPAGQTLEKINKYIS